MVLFLLGPVLRRWLMPMLQRWMLRKMEDNVRRMTGMPTRKEEKKARKKARKENKRRATASDFRRTAYKASRGPGGMMQYVAEDVEFTEIKEVDKDGNYTEKTSITYTMERQVTDADFIEIKDSRKEDDKK